MQAPSAAELLVVWERARAQPMTTQALMLLAAASPGASWEDLAKLSVGRRDERLLVLREALFGARLLGLTSCPRCRQQLEIGIQSTDIHIDGDQSDRELLSVTSGAYVARFRLPNSEDLSAIAGRDDRQPDEAATIRKLLSRCLVELRRNGRRQRLDSSHGLPPALIEAIAAEMEKADPQANVQIPLDCADCGNRWLSAFDIVSFLWSEIDNWAKRLLREVCALASAFGWSESDILAMSAQRRQLYLQMIGDAA
ncbi:MAG TPA: phage baseplate protein [Blastocatellia bacterium]|nr:phage baseplate protein [Blastocatellia bacterium]